MGSRSVVDKKACALEPTQGLFRLQSGELGSHADSKATRISSFTGSSGMFLSRGMGSPSLRRLSI